MNIHLLALTLCFGLINAQSLYYQRQKEHREGRAHPNQQRQRQQQPWQRVQQRPNQRQQQYQQYGNQNQGRKSNYQYYSGYRNVNGQGMSIIGPGMYDASTAARASLSLQLTSYTNEQRWLPHGLQCYDNAPAAPLPGGGTPRTPTAAGNSDRDCQLTFTTIVSVPNAPPTVIQTQEFLQLTQGNGGNVDLTQTVVWSEPRTFDFSQKPTSIDVIVLHSGNERYRNKTTWPWNSGIRYNVLMDVFNKSTADDQPGTGATGSGSPITLTGAQLQTALGIRYSITCLKPFEGNDCDLECNRTSANQNSATVCTSAVTGNKWVCTRGSYPVSGCTECVNGLYGDECMGPTGVTRVLQSGVSSGWRTIGIIFIILTVILAVILLALIFFWWCCTRNREEKRANWSEWPYARGRQEEPQPSPTRAAPPIPVKASVNGTESREPSYRPSEQNPEWYQPNVVSVNSQRASAPPESGSHHSSQMGDDRGSESSYAMRTGRMTPRREAAV